MAHTGAMPGTHYLVVEEVSERLRLSRRTLHELTRQATGIPHRKLPGIRRLLFVEDELDAWIDGAELERLELPGGGRIVKPRTTRE